MLLIFAFLYFSSIIFSKPPDFRCGINDSPAQILRQSKELEAQRYPLELEWDLMSKTSRVIQQQDGELYFLYSLASYQKEFWNDKDLSTIFDRLSVLDQTLFSSDLLVQHLFAKENFKKIADLPIFKELNQDLEPDVLLIGACALDQTGNTTEADRYFSFLEKTFAENEQIIHQVIVRLVKQNEYRKALEKIDNFLKNTNPRPKHSTFFCLKAYVLADFLNKPEEALSVINAGLELNPRSEKLLRLKFALLIKSGVSEETLNVLQSLVTLSNDPELRNILISFYYKQGEFAKALEEMQQLSIESPEHLLNKALLLIKIQKEEEALSLIEACLSKNPNHTELKSMQLQLLLNTQQFDKLAKLLIETIEECPNTQSEITPKLLVIAPKCSAQEEIIKKLFSMHYKITDVFLYMALADLCLSCGFYSYANHIYGVLEPLLAKHAVLKAKMLCAIAKIYFETGNADTAVSLVHQALQICPKLLIGWQLLADYFFKINNLEKAKKFTQKGLRLNPVDQSLQCLQYKIYREKLNQQKPPPIFSIIKQNPNTLALYFLQGK